MATKAAKKFLYVQGLLYVRDTQFKGEPQIEKKLEFEKPGDKPFHTHSIARVRNGVSEVYGGGWYECMEGESGQSGAGLNIVRRLATDDDIREIVSCYHGDKDPQDLVDMVDNCGIHDAEKLRFRRIFSEVVTKQK